MNFYFNLPELSNNPQFKYGLREKVVEKVSQRKIRTITRLDTFFVSQPTNFGKSVISTNIFIKYFEGIIYTKKIIFLAYPNIF